ncbi:hypothetical protein FRC10_002163 [Ceratobasidium sp. 414]|nr:hypothetical protein FRC10_002163 [Ceratobasidium sp. 414]
MVQPRSSHSTPPLHPHHQHHPGNAGYLSPRTLAGTLDSWNDAIPSARRSPSPLSPSAMGSFVNKAKAMLRGKRNSVQATPAEFASGKLETRRVTSHYQTRSAMPPPQRQATAPLPSRRLTKSRSPRPPLKKSDGSYAISSPITSNTEATYKYCELIDTADMAARASQFLRPRQHLVRSPSPPQHSDIEPQGLPTRRFTSSHSVDRTSTAQDTDSLVEILHATRDAANVYGSRPVSDVFPLSVTASSSRFQVETTRFVGLKDGVLATFDGYESHESHESLTECHAPFEYDCLTPTGPQDFTGTSAVQEPGFGVSETIQAISNAGMLDGSGTYGSITGLDQKLGNIFAADEGDYEAELAHEPKAGYPLALAWLGAEVGAYPTNQGEDECCKDSSRDIVDEYLGFGEDTLMFSMCPLAQDKPLTAPDRLPIPAAPNTPERTVRDSSRPMGIAQCLASMAAGGSEALLTAWRAQLDPTCGFILLLADEQRSVEIFTNNSPTSEQSVIIDTKLYPSPLAPVEPLRITKPVVPRSRSKSLLSVPVSASPPASIRRPKTGHARRVTSGQSISVGLWEPASAPPTTNLFAILDPHPIASSSRMLHVEAAAESVAAQDNTMTKRRRNTREMFFESQVAHVMKGSRGAGVGGSTRCRYRVPAPYKSLEPARSLKHIDTKGLSWGEGEENSAEWIPVSPMPARPSHALPKSPARRALYVSPPKSSSSSRRTQSGSGMSKSPSTRGGMVKSPSVRSGLAKSGLRRGLSAFQSRSGLHASPSQPRNGVRAHAYGSPSRRGRFPASPSTRSLPDSPQKVIVVDASPPSRPLRSGVRPKSERRQPGFWDDTGKENVPAETHTERERQDTTGPESPLQSRAAKALHLGFGSPGSLSDDYQAAWSHNPNVSAPESPRRRKLDESDMMCTHAKALVAEIMNDGAMVCGPGAPIVPARSPARPRTYNRI